jgi:hypothetical protein
MTGFETINPKVKNNDSRCFGLKIELRITIVPKLHSENRFSSNRLWPKKDVGGKTIQDLENNPSVSLFQRS